MWLTNLLILFSRLTYKEDHIEYHIESEIFYYFTRLCIGVKSTDGFIHIADGDFLLTPPG